MNKVAKFEKVSFDQFLKDMEAVGFNGEDYIRSIYDNIKLPVRKTPGSAGYDFSIPFNIDLDVYDNMVIPTGIRCTIEDGWFLGMFPRSGHGFKNHVRLANTVGIIDADYAYSDNEGHIMIKLINGDVKPLVVKAGDGFAQGILLPFGITHTDENDKKEIRNGGFGSTSK